jgi:hypothetical protein
VLINLSDYEQRQLLIVVRDFMETLHWTPASKLENGELAIPLKYFAKPANAAAKLLETIRPEEREKWCIAVGWPDSTATLEAISQHIGISVSDMLDQTRCFNDGHDAGYFAWEQTHKTGDGDATHSLFNKYRGNKDFWKGVYDSKTKRHWRPWIPKYTPEEYAKFGSKADRPNQYTNIEVMRGDTGERISLNTNELPKDFDPERTVWRPLL